MRPFLALAALAASATAKLTYRGADFSSLLTLEKSGKTFKSTSGAPQAFEKTLAQNGVNNSRQRIWVNPSSGDYNLAYNLALAKRAVAAGMSVYIDFHYSDDWADPQKQITPAAWKKYTKVEDLAKQVYTYTQSVCDAFAAESIPVEIMAIGNEIRTGLLWDLGKAPQWKNIATLLKAGSSAIRESKLAKKPKVMVHLDNGYDTEMQKWWYNSMLGAGPFKSSDFDAIGVSFYPPYSARATFSNLATSLRMLKSTYQKEVMVVETDWPATAQCPGVSWPSDQQSIEKSVSGQAAFLKKLATTTEQAGGTGLWYWEPGMLGNAGLGSKCWDLLMVESDGKARNSLAVFKEM